jgi:two-component system OmpR family sensor kinase
VSARIPSSLDHRWRLVPFRARLTLGFALVMVILFGGLALLLHVVVENSLDQQINRSLQARSVDLSTLVGGRPIASGLPALPDSDGTFAQIIDPSTGTVVAETTGHAVVLLDPAHLRAALSDPGGLVNDGPARLRVESIGTRPHSVLVVGVSLAQRNHTLTVLSEMLFVGGPVLLLLTCLAGYVLAARALAPVESMSVQASRISGAPAGKRLPIPEARDEIRRLGDTLNDLLARVEEALARERSFVSDASHELRTPLAVLKLELEFALASDISRDELQARVRSAAEEVDRLTKVAQDLLFIARADQGRLPLERRRVEVGAVLDAVADRFAQPARLRERVVSAGPASPALFVNADQTWLEQALNNLVSNALRYGGGPVVLSARERGGTVEMHVLDQGCGFEPAFLECAFERFARSDPARSGIGVGLGLAIVRAIAEAHGGSAGAANRPTGGADVWIAVPASAELAARPAAEPITERIT